jgi:hypothetical protein
VLQTFMDLWNELLCAFRRSQPLIPIEADHRFRLKPAGDSDEVGQGGGSDLNGVSLR